MKWFASLLAAALAVGPLGIGHVHAELDGGLPSQFSHLHRGSNLTVGVVNLAKYAVGDCAVDDTQAFNLALAVANVFGQPLYIPKAPGGCYLVGAINQTSKPGIYVYGDGDASVLKINGFSPTNKNWWDMTGSNDTRLENFKVLGTSGIVPKVLFFAAANNTAGTLTGIAFDHVSVDAYSSEGHLYAFNVTYNNSNAFQPGAGGLTCRNSVWYQRANGGAASTANPTLRTAAAIFDGANSRTLASDYATVAAGSAGTQSIKLDNCNFISYPPSGAGAGTKDANSGIVLVNTGQFEMTNGSVQCLSLACAVLWNNTEGVHFSSTVFKNSDGGGAATATTDYWIYYGGGTVGNVMFDNVLWSDLPNAAGNAGYMGFDVTLTQLANLKARSVDIGANTSSNKFITTVGGCGGHTASTFQLYQANIEFWDVNNAIQICDSIDKSTTLAKSGTITLISVGATDASFQPGGPARVFSTLPTCNAANQGASRLISDSNTAVFNAIVAAGGANVIVAWCDGSNWRVH